jgi:hypothetical protein
MLAIFLLIEELGLQFRKSALRFFDLVVTGVSHQREVCRCYRFGTVRDRTAGKARE